MMGYRLNGYFKYPKDSNTLTITGTDPQAVVDNSRANVSNNRMEVLSGSISNVSQQDCKIYIEGDEGHQWFVPLKAYSTIKFKNIPVRNIGIAVNGTVVVKGIGILLVALNDQALGSLLATASIDFVNDNESERLDNGATAVTVDLTVLRAALTSIVPAGFTDIRQMAILRISTGATYNIRVDYPNNNVTLIEDETARGDFYNGNITDVLVSNAAQGAGTELILLLFRQVPS